MSTNHDKLKRPSAINVAEQLLPTSSAPPALEDQVQAFAETLINLHGSIKVATEASGLHFYLACPKCLEAEGESELFKKHLAVNVDKYFAGQQHGVLCMKCGWTCEAVDLQYFPPLEQRGITHKPEIVKFHGVNKDYLEQDHLGVMVPKNPGVVIPVTELPADHPALEYLASRGFDPKPLWEQFECSWGETENPNLFYRRQPGGFRITPQGRLIFFCFQNGSKVGWQARILEIDEADKRYFWHPYRKEWVHVMTRESDRWLPREGYEEWDHAKYWTAPGTRRNTVVMGYDAAVRWNQQRGRILQGDRIGILTEGPLDAGRLGPPVMAILGKTLTADQATTIASQFHRLIIIGDNDKAGLKMKESVQRQLTPKQVRFEFMDLPERFKDPGSLSQNEGKMFASMAIKRASQL